MAKMGWFGKLWLTRFSKPVGERPLYRQIFDRPPHRILEIGIGTLARTERLLKLLRGFGDDSLQYVGLDRFEGRLPTDPSGVSLKQAHQRLSPLAKVQLGPGNADSALSRVSNHLGTFDLVLVSADNDQRHMERSWFFLQRLVRPESVVFIEPLSAAGIRLAWQPLEQSRLADLASRSVQRRAAA